MKVTVEGQIALLQGMIDDEVRQTEFMVESAHGEPYATITGIRHVRALRALSKLLEHRKDVPYLLGDPIAVIVIEALGLEIEERET